MGQVVKIDEKAWIKDLLGEMFLGTVEGRQRRDAPRAANADSEKA